MNISKKKNEKIMQVTIDASPPASAGSGTAQSTSGLITPQLTTEQ